MRFVNDLTQATRTLRRQSGWAVAVVTLLVLGLGANLAIFTVLHAVVLQAPPFPQGERLVMVWETREATTTRPAAPANFLDWRREARSFEGLAALRFDQLSWTGDGPPQIVAAGFASGNLFQLLGVKPVAGRLFDLADEAGGADRVVVSEALWRRQFGGGAAVGRTMVLGERPYQVVGVLPAGFSLLRPADVWVVGARGIPGGAPIASDPATVRDAHYLRVLGRLRPGVTLEAAKAEMANLAGRLALAYPETNRGLGGNVTTLQATLAGSVRPTLLAMQSGGLLLLLVALANAATLLVARAVQRAREVAVRQVLGANRGALLREAFAEGLLLCLSGAVLAAGVAWMGTRALVRLAPAGLPRISEIAVGPAGLVGLLALAGAAAALFAVLPLAQRVAPSQVLRGSTAGMAGAGGRAGRLRSGLTVAQLVLAYVLVTGAVLLATSFGKLRAVETGVHADDILAAELTVSPARRADPAAKNRFYVAALERLRAVPGVQAAELTLTTPLAGAMSRGFWIEGRSRRGPNQVDIVEFQTVSAGYFKVLGIPVRGRGFGNADATGPRVAIINRVLAEQYFPGLDPIGKRLGVGQEGDPAQLRTIIGVSGNVREDGLAEPAPPMMYVPFEQNLEPWNMASLLVKSGNPSATAGLGDAVRRALLEVDPDQALNRLQPLSEAFAGQLAPRRFTLQLASLFAGVALLIAALGTYAVVAFETSRRRREFGIRLALGARVRQLSLGVLIRGARLAALGLPAGILLAFSAARLLRGLLFGVGPGSVAPFAGGAALLLAVVALASLGPARRAGRTAPAEALRDE
ncbi:MAG: ADOP family duplicated permease [Acidobacteriota bacterium]